MGYQPQGQKNFRLRGASDLAVASSRRCTREACILTPINLDGRTGHGRGRRGCSPTLKQPSVDALFRDCCSVPSGVTHSVFSKPPSVMTQKPAFSDAPDARRFCAILLVGDRIRGTLDPWGHRPLHLHRAPLLLPETRSSFRRSCWASLCDTLAQNATSA